MEEAGQRVGDGLRLDVVASQKKTHKRPEAPLSLRNFRNQESQSLGPRHIAVRSSQVLEPLASA